MDISEYVHINWEKLRALPARERIEILGELARSAGKIAADARAEEIDNLRVELGSDAAVAKYLGIERQALQGIGDGPAVKIRDGVFARPLLIRRTAEIMLNYHHVTASTRYLMDALEILNRRGRPNPRLIEAAAQRLWRAASSYRHYEDMSPEERRTLRRGLAHAAEVVPESNG